MRITTRICCCANDKLQPSIFNHSVIKTFPTANTCSLCIALLICSISTSKGQLRGSCAFFRVPPKTQMPLAYGRKFSEACQEKANALLTKMIVANMLPLWRFMSSSFFWNQNTACCADIHFAHVWMGSRRSARSPNRRKWRQRWPSQPTYGPV